MLSKRPPTKEQAKQISVRRILAGERILEKRETYMTPTYHKIYTFLENMPASARYTIEVFSLVVL